MTNRRPDDETLRSLRSVFRSYKRLASRLRDGAEDVAESGAIQFSVSWRAGESLEATFDEQPELVRLAALLRPFLSFGSSVELTAVWSLLQEHDLVDEETRKQVDGLFAAAENLGIAVVVNDRPLTSRDIYDAYAEGRFFDEKPEAKERLNGLSIGPMCQMVPFLFHNACIEYSRVVFAVLDVILMTERSHLDLRTPRAANPTCIYCLGQDGDFGPEEHVIPEALGGDSLVLHDAVCGACNNELSQLDQYLAESEILGLLRVLYVPLTKKGRFPRAQYRDFTVEKTRPRDLLLTSRSSQEYFSVEEHPDGTVRISLQASGRVPLDSRRLERSLFKIGLGLVAHDAGSEYACGDRFNATRDFVFGRKPMPNHLWMLKKAIPEPSITTTWMNAEAGTAVALSFYGVCFAFNLEPNDFAPPKDAPTHLMQSFWLGEGADEDAEDLARGHVER